jgi:prevent-host-death family protein
MKKAALSKVKDDLSKYLRLAEKEEIVITRHGKPAGVLIGFESEEDWFDWRLENDPRFLRRVEEARRNLRARRGVRLEDIEEERAVQLEDPSREEQNVAGASKWPRPSVRDLPIPTDAAYGQVLG